MIQILPVQKQRLIINLFCKRRLDQHFRNLKGNVEANEFQEEACDFQKLEGQRLEANKFCS